MPAHDLNPAKLEAEIRDAMWHHSQIRPDGYDPEIPRCDRLKARARIRAEIDALLDQWANSRLLVALDSVDWETL